MNLNIDNQYADNDGEALRLRKPFVADGLSVHLLIAECPPLDTNSLYSNLLQCSHFANTCCIAERDGKIVGFVSAYPLPDKIETLFVWQVAVHHSMRGHGLALKMLRKILSRPVCKKIRYLETTITANNKQSRKMFYKLADVLNCEFEESPGFSREQHFDNEHDDEFLLSIGPFNTLVDSMVNIHPYMSHKKVEI